MLRPTRKADADDLSERQRSLLKMLRLEGELSVEQARTILGIADPSHFFSRLHKRGLVQATDRPGVYRAAPIGEVIMPHGAPIETKPSPAVPASPASSSQLSLL